MLICTVYFFCDFNPLPPHGGRPFIFSARRRTGHFNPLPPHGGRQDYQHTLLCATEFQSTPSAWRETLEPHHKCRQDQYFNPLPPHGGRLTSGTMKTGSLHFNPLPPHGGRPDKKKLDGMDLSFQSTPSAWRETLTFDYCRVSINHFNPLPPHGGRPEREKAERFPLSISIHSLRMEGDSTA